MHLFSVFNFFHFDFIVNKSIDVRRYNNSLNIHKQKAGIDNITKTYDYLKGIASDLHVVRGDMDDAPSLPYAKLIQHGPIRFGVVHGHQVIPNGDEDDLACTARQLDVDVLIHGYTHQWEARERIQDGRFYVNPGSATGSFSIIKG